MNAEKIRTFAYVTVAALGAMLAIYIFFKYVFFLALPFLIASLIAYLMDRPSAYLCRKLHLSARVIRVSLTVLSTLATLGVFVLLVWGLSVKIGELISGGGLNKIAEMIGSLTAAFGGVFGRLGEGVGEAVYTLISSFVESIGSFLSGFARGIPRALLFLLVTVISAVYMSLDLEHVADFLRRILPFRAVSLIGRLKNSLFTTLARYLRSYLLLMLLTFAVILSGLVILRAPEALLLAAVISLLDVLPVLGVGTVLIPWSLYSFISGGTVFGVGLLILYLLHTVIRQLAEPKIVGKSLGVHPIITLVLLYVGYSLFGFFGILLVPLFTILLEVALGKDKSTEVGEYPTRK